MPTTEKFMFSITHDIAPSIIKCWIIITHKNLRFYIASSFFNFCKKVIYVLVSFFLVKQKQQGNPLPYSSTTTSVILGGVKEFIDNFNHFNNCLCKYAYFMLNLVGFHYPPYDFRLKLCLFFFNILTNCKEKNSEINSWIRKVFIIQKKIKRLLSKQMSWNNRQCNNYYTAKRIHFYEIDIRGKRYHIFGEKFTRPNFDQLRLKIIEQHPLQKYLDVSNIAGNPSDKKYFSTNAFVCASRLSTEIPLDVASIFPSIIFLVHYRSIEKTVSVSRYDNICCTTSCSERSLGLSTAKKHNFV
ncbi:hypothetical protein AGLY_002234 [Aphis glycines]|uniref:Uncharacterized protein n=1 Tax=Aphis glycines TaxID=307491 RepID=A0A6G0U2X9_APHGL|nr:hypothetical protein AGLY_002234 [Aphis glycines]